MGVTRGGVSPGADTRSLYPLHTHEHLQVGARASGPHFANRIKDEAPKRAGGPRSNFVGYAPILSNTRQPPLHSAHRFERRAVGTLFASTRSVAVERDALRSPQGQMRAEAHGTARKGEPWERTGDGVEQRHPHAAGGPSQRSEKPPGIGPAKQTAPERVATRGGVRVISAASSTTHCASHALRALHLRSARTARAVTPLRSAASGSD
jgi:hypothetical protein